MAVKLNKHRMRDSRILVIVTILTGFFFSTLFHDSTIEHNAMDFAGYLLVMACAIGRIYCTAFIGGSKNVALITWGPYSLCRNPLYFCSIVGAAGIGLMSTSIIAFLTITIGFIFIYLSLIQREEAFLSERFGADFAAYRARIPRLVPSLQHVNYPAEVTFQPQALNRAMLDAIWWFAPYMIFELAEYLQDRGIVTPIALLP